MSGQLKKGILEMVVLNIISEEECYGYAIVTKINDTMYVKETAIYTILTRLKQNSFLNVRIGSNNNRKVKFYSLSDKGRLYLKELLDEWQLIKDLVEESVSNE